MGKQFLVNTMPELIMAIESFYADNPHQFPLYLYLIKELKACENDPVKITRFFVRIGRIAKYAYDQYETIVHEKIAVRPLRRKVYDQFLVLKLKRMLGAQEVYAALEKLQNRVATFLGTLDEDSIYYDILDQTITYLDVIQNNTEAKEPDTVLTHVDNFNALATRFNLPKLALTNNGIPWTVYSIYTFMPHIPYQVVKELVGAAN